MLHLYFEEDTLPTFEGGAQAKSRMRSTMYREFYDLEYQYEVPETDESMQTASTGPGGRRYIRGDAEDFDQPPVSRATKPYIPPTNPEDLHAILGVGPVN